MLKMVILCTLVHMKCCLETLLTESNVFVMKSLNVSKTDLLGVQRVTRGITSGFPGLAFTMPCAFQITEVFPR